MQFIQNFDGKQQDISFRCQQVKLCKTFVLTCESSLSSIKSLKALRKFARTEYNPTFFAATVYSTETGGNNCKSNHSEHEINPKEGTKNTTLDEAIFKCTHETTTTQNINAESKHRQRSEKCTLETRVTELLFFYKTGFI